MPGELPARLLPVMAKDDDYRRGEGDEEAAAEAPGAPRKRLAWIDWCRTQSVYNVVCGHAWWGALDAMPKAVKDACKPFCGWQGYVDAAGRPLMSETMRMVDYTVDIGALHGPPPGHAVPAEVDREDGM